MPTNITQGNTAQFVVEFLDSDGELVVPDSGTLVVTYTLLSDGSSTSDSISLTQDGSFWTGSWDSSVAALGPAAWTVSAPTVTATSGELRIIDP